MSPMVVLTGLLVVAYLGSILVGGRAIRGYGLPSGTEFLLLGILVGPKAMGLVPRSALVSFEPLTLVALGWLALTIGVHYGYTDERRVPARRMLAGVALASATLVAAASATLVIALLFTSIRGMDLLLLCLGVGCVSSETTRHAVRWVAQRYEADGPLVRLVADVCEADDAVPLVLLAVIFALVPDGQGSATWPAVLRVIANLAAGAVMGGTCAALVDIEPRTSQRWGIVLGTSLLGIGASIRLDLSAVTTMFVMGIVVSAVAREREAVHSMLASTERAVMLPALVLAGASAVYPGPHPLFALAAAALVARMLVKLAAGAAFARGASAPTTVGPALGLGLMPAGVLTITAGLTFALQVRGAIGDVVLAIATMHAVLGELVGPAMLRRALALAGELRAVESVAPVRKVARTPRPRRRASTRGSLTSGSELRRSDPEGRR
jgi:hypothetical protein